MIHLKIEDQKKTSIKTSTVFAFADFNREVFRNFYIYTKLEIKTLVYHHSENFPQPTKTIAI